MAASGVDDRRIAILRKVIEHYVTTGQPVGSTHIASMPGVSVSAATVRSRRVARTRCAKAGRGPSRRGV